MSEADPMPEDGGAEATTLCEELVRLAAELCAEVPSGDERRLREYCRHRDRLVELIRRAREGRERGGVEPDGSQGGHHRLATAIRQVVDLDRRLVPLLEGQRARVGQALARVRLGRTSLESYRASGPGSPVSFDRVV